MKKYIRAMFFGSAKTKMFLWTIVLVALASIFCIGAVAMGGSVYFAYAAFGGILFSITYSQLGMFRDVTAQLKEDGQLEASIHKKQKNGKKDYMEQPDIAGKKQSATEEESGEENPLAQYNDEKLKKLLVTYKVNKESFLVLIDSSEKYHIKKCPGYVWSDKKNLLFLLLEKKPRTIAIPRKETEIMRYEKGVVITDMEEYKHVKDSIFLNSMYRDLYPDYYRAVTNGLRTFKKNLFVIGEDIRITTKSAKGVMKAAQCRLELNQWQFDRQRYSSYFEEAYKANLLLREKVYDQEEFKEKMREILVGLAEHEEKIETYQSIVLQMVQYHFISQEYADFYMNYKSQLEQKRRKNKK